MGFCYLKPGYFFATTAAARSPRRTAVRVAVWDFDAHHGQRAPTEDILKDRHGKSLFASVHQFPGYPGKPATHSFD